MSANAKGFEVHLTVKTATAEGARRVIAAAMNAVTQATPLVGAAIQKEKSKKMSESSESPRTNISSGPGSPGVYAPHVQVDANRGTRIPAADQRDAKKPA